MSYKYGDSQHEAQRLKGGQTSMVWISYFNFTACKKVHSLIQIFGMGYGFCILMSLYQLGDEWGGRNESTLQ